MFNLRKLVCSIASVLLAGASFPAIAVPTAAELIEVLDASGRAKLLAGDIVVTPRPKQETSDAGLAIALAVIVPADLSKSVQAVQAVSIEDDPKLRRSVGEIKGASKGDGSHKSFAGLSFRPEEEELAKRFALAEPGDDYNFSKEELGWLRAIREPKAQSAAKVLEVMRRVLDKRYAAYRTRGLEGIAPYARAGGKETKPGAELASTTEQMLLLRKGIPELYEAYRHYPARSAEGLQHRYFWEKKTVEGQLMLSLRHEVVQLRSDYAVIASREYYISGQLDTYQVAIVLVPHKAGTLVTMANQTFTQNVTGAKRFVAVRIGRSIVESNTRPIFEKVQARLGRIPAGR
jgi:hypothetical protein